MNIVIIGTGRMGSSLGKGWANAGHGITFASRSPEARSALTSIPGAVVMSYEAALASGPDVVLVTLPYPAVEPFARQYAPQLRGPLVIDISNPFDHLPDNRIAGAEVTASAIGPGARVVAAFKDNFAATLLHPIDGQGRQRDVHFAGDSDADKQIVARLVEDLGFQPVDCGPLKHARILDGMVTLIIDLDRRYGGQSQSSWKLLH